MINPREEKNQRRKRIMMRYHLAAVLGYLIPLMNIYAARLLNFISTDYFAINVFAVYVCITSLFFITLCALKKNITERFANVMYISQYVIWLCVYFYAIIIINEIRTITLLWGFIALVFLLSQAGFRIALAVTTMAFFTYIVGAYIAIHVLKQSGSFSSELLYALVFLFIGIFLSYTAGLFKKQRSELRSFQKKLKDEKEKAMEAEAALRESEEKYRHFIEHANDIIYKSDWRGNFIFVNEGSAKVFGYSSEELLRMNYLDVILPERRDEEFRFYKNQLKNRVAESIRELPCVARDGRVIWIDQNVKSIFAEDGRIIEFDSIAHDITERKKAAEELRAARDIAERANRAKSKFLAGMSHELRTPLNSINGIIELLCFGSYDRDEDILPLIEKLIKEIKIKAISSNNSGSGELEIIASELGEAMNYMAGDGNFKRYFFTRVRDRLSKIGLSDEEETPEKTAEQIAAFVDSEEKEIASAYRRIKESGDYLLALIDDVLNLSKVETGSIEINKTDVDIAGMTRSFMSDAASYAKARGKEAVIRFHSDVESSVPQTITCDEQKIRQVLLNFLSNAVKFTESGSVSLNVSAKTESGSVRFTVTDTGIGISEEEKKLLFVEFGRTSAVKEIEGSGLGLFISERLVKLQGGRIGFESEQGKGSSFWFELPI